MKGLSPRERIGLLSLATVVAGCLLIGMLDWDGCARNQGRDSGNVIRAYEVLDADSSANNADNRRDYTRGKSRRDTTYRSDHRKKSSRKKKAPKQKEAPERRSLRDEHL